MELNAASTGEEMVALWGRQGLRRCPARVLRDVSIPDSSKYLLAEFGLPAFWDHTYLVGVEDALPRLSAERPHLRILGQSFKGTRAPDFVCLDEQQAGAIIHVWHGSDPGEEMVNTSVERFAASLVLHRRLLSETDVLSRQMMPPSADERDTEFQERQNQVYKRAVDDLLQQIEQEMRRLDPQVWQGVKGDRHDNWDDESWGGHWPSMLGDFGEYSMWDAEEVFSSWSTAEE